MPRRYSIQSVLDKKPILDQIYQRFNHGPLVDDPVHLVRCYQDPADQEVVGFCAAALAFGRVASMLDSIKALLRVAGPSPSAFVRGFNPSRQGHMLSSLRHRWTSGSDLVLLLTILRRMIDSAGSIEGFFLRGYRSDADDVGKALDDFSERAINLVNTSSSPGVRYFFPKPANGSACKRLNLYLRWMVRRDSIDLGTWQGVSMSKLVVPLDVHVIRVAQCLRLTRYRSPGWPMATEITNTLRRLNPNDPVKYDFSLCHLGMQNTCGFNQKHRDTRCPLRGSCRPVVRRRRVSR